MQLSLQENISMWVLVIPTIYNSYFSRKAEQKNSVCVKIDNIHHLHAFKKEVFDVLEKYNTGIQNPVIYNLKK